MALGLGGATVARIKALVEVDSSSMSRGLHEAESKTSKVSKGFGFLAKSVGAVGVGIAATTAAVKFGSAVWDDYNEGQKVAGQTAAVLKSTGNAAHVTADQVGNLASAIAAKSGQDDAAIQSGENMLLTFKNLRNEQGKGNDMFNQATKAMADMNQAMGQDSKTSAIQLGKALNDPIHGMSALQRIGITFSDSQKKAITKMVETGNVLGAQKLMLKEVNSEVGGSAEAYGKTLPGMIDRAKNAVIDFSSNALGKYVMPALTEWATALAKFVQSKEFQKWMASAKHAVIVFIQDSIRVWNMLAPVVVPIVQLIIKMLKRYYDVVADVARLVDALIHGKWSDAWHQFKNLVSDAVHGAVANVRDAAGLILRALGALVGAAKSKARDIGVGIKNAITGGLAGIGGGIAGLVRGAINSLIDAANRGLNVIHDHWPDIPGAPGPPFGHSPIPHMASGGLVRGGRPGADSVLAMLMPGEMVLNTSQQSRLAALLGLPGSGVGGSTPHLPKVEVHQTIISGTDDQGVHMRRAQFAATAAFA